MPSKKAIVVFVLVSLVSHAVLLFLTGIFPVLGGSSREEVFTVNLPPEEVPAQSSAAPASPPPSAHDTASPDDPVDMREETVNLDSVTTPYTPYLQRVRKKIGRLWIYPQGAARRKEVGTTVIRFSIGRNGDLKALLTMASSGYPSVDESALMAVRSAAPFDTLPSNLGKLTIIATFRSRLAP